MFFVSILIALLSHGLVPMDTVGGGMTPTTAAVAQPADTVGGGMHGGAVTANDTVGGGM